MQGLKGVTIRANSRLGEPELTSEQRTEMENIFDQRDCAYRDDLYNHSLFHLLYQHDGFWPENCTKTKAMPIYRYNASVVYNEFRRILRCPGYESGHIQQAFMQKESKTYISLSNELPVQAAAYLILALIAAVLGMRLHARKRKATGPVNQDEGKAANR
jgi:hypothetical protein